MNDIELIDIAILVKTENNFELIKISPLEINKNDTGWFNELVQVKLENLIRSKRNIIIPAEIKPVLLRHRFRQLPRRYRAAIIFRIFQECPVNPVERRA